MNFYINPDFPYQTGRNPRLYWDNKRRTPPGIYLAGFWSSKKRKEGKYALIWTRLSCTRFSSNQVRLALFVLAYNPVSYTHLRAHETRHDLVCRLLLEKKKNKNT